MLENESRQTPPPAAPPMLEYGRPNRVMAPGWQFTLGILLSTVSVLALAFTLPFVMGIPGLIVGILLPAGVLFVIGLQLRRGGTYRPMAAGIWTGIALAMLVDGLCWVALSGIRIGG